MQRKKAIAGLALTFVLFATGCTRSRVVRTGVERTFAGITVRVACPDESTRQVVEEYGKSWESRTGGRIEIQPFGAGGQPAAGAADVWVLAAADVPELAARNQLLPLPSSITDEKGPFAWTGLLDLYRYYLLGWGDISYAVPLQGEAVLCFYRTDKLADPVHQSAYRSRYGRSLRPPQTWDEFADIAEYFAASPDPQRRTPSLPPMPADDSEFERLFYAVAAPYARRSIRQDIPAAPDTTENDKFSFHFDLDRGEPRIAAKGFVHGLTLLQRMQRCVPPAGPAAEPWKAFLAGNAVLCATDCRRLREFQAQGSPVRDRVGVVPLPGSSFYFDYRTGERQPLEGNRVPYQGTRTHVLVVPHGAANADAAFDLLADLGGPATSMQIVLEPRWGGGATRTPHLDRERWDAFQLPPDATRALGEALRQTHLHQVSNAVVCLRHPWHRDFTAALAPELRKALVDHQQGEKRAAKALESVAASWKARIGKGADEHLRFYLTGLRR